MVCTQFIRGISLGALVSILGCQTQVNDIQTTRSPVSVGTIEQRPYGKWFSTYSLSNATLQVVVVPDTGRIHLIAPPSAANLLWENEAMGNLLRPGDSRAEDAGGIFFVPDLPSTTPWHAKAWINEDGSQICHVQTRIADQKKRVHSVLMSLSPESPVLKVTHRMTRIGYSKDPEQFVAGCHTPPAWLHVIPIDAGLKGQIPTARQINCDDALLFINQPDTDTGSILLPAPWFAAFSGRSGVSIRAHASRTETASLQSQTQDGRNRTALFSEHYPLSPGQSLQMTYTIRIHSVGTWPDPCDAARVIAGEVLN